MLKNKLLSAMGGAPANYIEDVFSTYLYTGNSSTQTITNGIDLAGKGGLVWTKGRSAGLAGVNHWLSDTARGIGYSLASDSTAAQSGPYSFITLGASGYSLNTSAVGLNTSGETYVSWTFREQPKFFDIVTWTGDSTAGRTVAHNLGSVPGCIIVKCTSQAVGGGWPVYHRSLGNTQTAVLNTTDAAFTYGYWNNTTPTSTVFTLNGDSDVNGTGKTYVAYLFAHDAGGFGLTGTDNVISCGSYVGDGSTVGPTVTLGYEPQWVLIKEASAAGNQWVLFDNMRGMPVGSNDNYLYPNLSAAESSAYNLIEPTATGFYPYNTLGIVNNSGSTYIYIAIRRGPMKVPTSGTSVFSPYTATLSAGTTVNAGLTPDLLFAKYRPGTDNPRWVDRLRGFANATGGTNPELYSNETSAESTSTAWSYNWNNTGYVIGNALNGLNSVIYALKRAPSFFDEVCYTGTGSARTVTHNLGVAPQLILTKGRSNAVDWYTYSETTGNGKFLLLSSTLNGINSSIWNSTSPTSTQFTVNGANNNSGQTFVAYLFATCPGVSKVGSYTGTGATQTIACGFTGGARFVMIKRTDSTGDWYYWDTARGMVSGNDRYLLMNSNVGETNTNSIYTASGGFEIVSTAAGINASGGTYIYLAIA